MKSTEVKTRTPYERPTLTPVQMTGVTGLAMTCCHVVTPATKK